MVNLSKQDVQGIVETAKNRMLDRVASKQDLQILNDTIKVMVSNQQQCQQLIRQSEYQRVQMMRRTVSLEARILQLDQELRNMRVSLDRLANSQPERILMPTETTPAASAAEPRYTYNPT